MSPKTARVREVPVEVISSPNPWITWLLGSVVIGTVIKIVGGYILKRTPPAATPADVMLKLVDQLQEEVVRLRQRLDEVETRNATMALAAEEREAHLVVRLRAVKDANEVKIQDLYKTYELTRIRLEAVEAENKTLRAQLKEMQEKAYGEPA